MRTEVNEHNVVLLRIRIVELRKEKGLSQVGLAKELGVDCSTIAKYETGDRLPDVVMLCKLASFFGVSTDYLLGRAPF
ncbi:MAG TPA: XRE family transcriptional regulator [Clostridiales bacterium]|nr:XRE family transcriptional regulator [Clostridiales bacterium]